jgi:hypothetical protein
MLLSVLLLLSPILVTGLASEPGAIRLAPFEQDGAELVPRDTPPPSCAVRLCFLPNSQAKP